MTEGDDQTEGRPSAEYRRPVIRNAVLLVLFLVVVLTGVVTVLLPALENGTEEEQDPSGEVTSESTDPAPEDALSD